MSTIERTRTAAGLAKNRPQVETGTVTLSIAALATVVMMQAMRVLVSYLIVVVGQANRTALERDTLVVFLAIALAPLLIWLMGLRATIVFTTAALALARLILQFWTQPNARLIIAASVVILWGWLVVALLGSDRQALAFGLIAGFALDVAIRAAFLTLDLPWNNSLSSGAVTIILVTLLLAGATLTTTSRTETSRAPGFSLSLLGVGPGLAMFYLMGGNLGLAQTKTGLDFAPATLLLALGIAAGVAGTVLLAREMNQRSLWLNAIERLLLVVIGAAALWLFWTNASLAPITLPFVVAANLILLASTILATHQPAARVGSILPTVWFTLGMLLQVGILFYYYDASGRTLYMLIAAALLGLTALLGTANLRPHHGALAFSAQSMVVVATSVVVLTIVALWQLAGVSNPTTGAALPATFKVMTYNLQDGFAADNSFDLMAQADTIAAARPDVVVLQEVSRGWLVTSGADEALWLSQRLNMPIYFGGNSDDALWGNAILTRAPASDVRRMHFSVTKNLKRGMIELSVPTGEGKVWIVGTHLDNPKAADDIRLEQIRQLIANLGDHRPAVVMGDFNADPGTAVLSEFDRAGFTDPGTTFLPAVYTTTDDRRLDYVLVSSGLQVQSMEAIDSPASDHKPVVADLTLGSR